MRHQLVFLAFIVSGIALIGCGSGGPVLYPVKGIVTVGGRPVEGVIVTFAPVDGRTASGGLTGADGKFELIAQSGKHGAVTGKHKVMLAVQSASAVTSSGSGPAAYEEMARNREGAMRGGRSGAPPAAVDPGKEKGITSIYSNPQKTPFEYDVAAKSNEFEVPVP